MTNARCAVPPSASPCTGCLCSFLDSLGLSGGVDLANPRLAGGDLIDHPASRQSSAVAASPDGWLCRHGRGGSWPFPISVKSRYGLWPVLTGSQAGRNGRRPAIAPEARHDASVNLADECSTGKGPREAPAPGRPSAYQMLTKPLFEERKTRLSAGAARGIPTPGPANPITTGFSPVLAARLWTLRFGPCG
jgi:hypothetical protein